MHRVVVALSILFMMVGCVTGDDGGGGGSDDCRQVSNACAEGFACLAVDADTYRCLEPCRGDDDCPGADRCDLEARVCRQGDGCGEICVHVRDGVVANDECGYADVVFDPTQPDRVDNNDIDPRDPQMRAYYATRADYMYVDDCGGAGEAMSRIEVED